MSGMLPFVVFVVPSSYAFQKDRDFFPAMKWFWFLKVKKYIFFNFFSFAPSGSKSYSISYPGYVYQVLGWVYCNQAKKNDYDESYSRSREI